MQKQVLQLLKQTLDMIGDVVAGRITPEAAWKILVEAGVIGDREKQPPPMKPGKQQPAQQTKQKS